jgi:RNA polymerase sigma factor (sigma-70 family)
MIQGRLTEKQLIDFYNSHIDKLYKFFFFKTLSKDVAEDLTSETFITFIKIIRDDNKIENYSSFLFGIAKNVFLTYLKQKYKDAISFSEIEDHFEEFIDKQVERTDRVGNRIEILEELLNKLPEKQRIVLSLRLLEKLSLNEIANKLNKDMNYVKTTQRRGIANLKKFVHLNSL